jgi:hypothetical protein
MGKMKQQHAGKRVMIRIIRLGLNLVRSLTDTYRPELHYMRGPGPKWREKHSRG